MNALLAIEADEVRDERPLPWTTQRGRGRPKKGSMVTCPNCGKIGSQGMALHIRSCAGIDENKKLAAIEQKSAVETFSEDVDYIAWDHGVSYMEAIIEWCETRGLDQEYAGSLVKKNRPLKARIEQEARELRCLVDNPPKRNTWLITR
jgi:hypothetical protein